ncbi:MAG: acetylxylan esterase [Verrucomicrobiota bacterium]
MKPSLLFRSGRSTSQSPPPLSQSRLLSLFSLFSLTLGLSVPHIHAVPPDAIMQESKVPPFDLPDVLVANDTQRIQTPSDWRQKRRPELLEMFFREIYGKTLLGRPDALKFVIREELPSARGGKATRLRVGVLFEGTEEGRQMELLVYLPNHVKGPVPVFLGLNFDGNYTTTAEPDLPVPSHWAMGLFTNKLEKHRPTESARGLHQHMWPYAYILEQGYGVVTAAYGEIEPDEPGGQSQGPRNLGPAPSAGDWGSIGAWAWGLSRAMDYLETNPRVDTKRVAVLGFSRLGKTALWAGAQDERFALVISNSSGAGGAALSKRIYGETVKHLTSKFPQWFAANFANYANNETSLPVDQHELLALIAPRPLLITSGTTDLWSDPNGEFLSAFHASPVYRLLGAEGISATNLPPPSVLVDSKLGYFLRPGGHDVTLEDWQAMIAFANKHLH